MPLIVLAPQPLPTVEEPFFSEAPPYWNPSVVAPPVVSGSRVGGAGGLDQRSKGNRGATTVGEQQG